MNDIQLPMPDVNTLIAVAWPNHIHHHHAKRWMETETVNGWATCPVIHYGFLRVSMNSHVVGSNVSFPTAMALLKNYTADSAHTFWESDASPAMWPQWLCDRIQGYRQVTDASLLATVVKYNGVLVTLDSGILTLVPQSLHSHVNILVP